MWIQALAALGGGALSAISSENARKKRNRKLDEAISELDKNKYDPEDKKIRLDEIADVYRSTSRNVENTQAAAGYLNANVVKALALSKIQPSYLAESNKALSEMDQYNKGIDMKKTELNLGKEDSNSLGDYLGGAAAFYQLGDAIDSKVNPSAYETAVTDYYGELTKSLNKTPLTQDKVTFSPFDMYKTLTTPKFNRIELKLGSREQKNFFDYNR